MSLGMIVIAVVCGGLMLEAICVLFHRFDIDYDEGCEMPHRWIAWGTCRSLCKKREYDFRYFFVKLPSWEWMQDFGRDNSWSWYQRTVLVFAGRWQMTFSRAD